jgi:hypothetical protein
MGMQHWVGGLVAASALFGATHASATLVEALSLRTLTKDAEQVFVGKVIDESSLYDDRERIVTDVRIQVQETVKGSLVPGQAIIVRKHGGAVDGIATRVLGEPGYVVGENVVLFAARQTPARPWRAVGMAQGVLRVFEEGGRAWVRSAPGDAATVQRSPNGTLLRAEAAIPAARPLEVVLDEIRGLASE